MTELVNQTEFASHCGVKQQSISLAIKRGDVIKEESGLIDLDNEKNYQYLRSAGEKAKKRARNKQIKEKEVLKDRSNQRILAELAKKEAEKNELKEELGIEIEKSLSETDLLDRDTARTRNLIQTAKAEVLFDRLIYKDIIETVFGAMERVIRKQGLTVGVRCAPTIAAEFGQNTPEMRRFVQSVIDKEQGRFLDGMKREIKKDVKNKR